MLQSVSCPQLTILHAVQPKYGGYLQHFTAQDVAYFRDMPFSLSIPSHGVLVVHAGIVPEKPLEEQLLSDMINVRPNSCAAVNLDFYVLNMICNILTACKCRQGRLLLFLLMIQNGGLCS